MMALVLHQFDFQISWVSVSKKYHDNKIQRNFFS